MVGAWFCILGGVFLSRVVVQPLTDLIPLTINLQDFDEVRRIARLFYSLSRALQQLSLFYQNLKLTPSDQRFFPYIWQFQFKGEDINFTYINEIFDDHTRTIWKAKKENGQIIVVKFTPKYNIEAHNICSSIGRAPDLLYCSDDNEAKTLWGFKMVIMEYISAISLDQKFIKGEIKTESCKVIYEDIKQAIGLLHEKNSVFADLRASNILIIDTEENQRAMLVDFDWCGKSDEGRYSPSMNKNISWPPGAKPRTLLRKDHDLYWLDVLLREFLRYVLFLSFNNLCVILALFIFTLLYIPVHQILYTHIRYASRFSYVYRIKNLLFRMKIWTYCEHF